MTTEFEKLLLNHISFMRYLAFNFTKDTSNASDLLQSTMENIVKNEANFQKDTNFKAWAHTIMRNVFINEYRKRKRQREWALTSPRQILSASKDTVENEGDQNLNIDFLQQAISNLEELYKIPFILHTEGYHYHEIADQLDIPIGTIKSRIHFARKKLQGSLKELKVR